MNLYKLFQNNCPTYGIRNISIYYLLAIFLNGWFVVPNWVFFYSRYLTIAQIGLIDGLSILIGMLLQVPTGALSDMLGKKRTIIFGSTSIILGSVLVLFAKDFTLFLLAIFCSLLGLVFIPEQLRHSLMTHWLRQGKKRSIQP